MSKPSSEVHFPRDARRIPAPDLERLRKTIIRHFAQHLYHQVGLREICREARVSAKTVYKYFGTKEELMLACVEPDLQALTELTRAGVLRARTAREALHVIARAQFAFYAAHPAVARVIFLQLPEKYWLERRSWAQAERDALFNAVLSESSAARSPVMKQDPGLLLDIAAGAVRRIIVRWLVEGQTGDLEARGESFLAVMDGLLSPD